MKLGLENIRSLLEALGNPENNYLKVQVAGTNGKGSVCGFLDAICVAAGVKTGVFTSPHLVSITERIKSTAPISAKRNSPATLPSSAIPPNACSRRANSLPSDLFRTGHRDRTRRLCRSGCRPRHPRNRPRRTPRRDDGRERRDRRDHPDRPRSSGISRRHHRRDRSGKGGDHSSWFQGRRSLQSRIRQ